MNRPPATAGLRHVAIFVEAFDACVNFYVDIMGMSIEWQPDTDNVYLCGGCDNLALHRRAEGTALQAQRLDHIGFILQQREHVDSWYDFMKSQGVTLQTEPKTHRDGARSFYCLDPDGTMVQIIHHPPIANF